MRLTTIPVLFAALAVSLPAAAAKPSFNCAKATHEAEQLVLLALGTPKRAAIWTGMSLTNKHLSGVRATVIPVVARRLARTADKCALD